MTEESIEKNRVCQRRYKAKFYDAGFVQKQIWIKEKSGMSKMDRASFMSKLDRLSKKLTEQELSELFSLFIQITEARIEKEVLKIKK
jgi:hypothetical protein